MQAPVCALLPIQLPADDLREMESDLNVWASVTGVRHLSVVLALGSPGQPCSALAIVAFLGVN